MAKYSFSSSNGQYPVTYNLYGGTCIEKIIKLVEVKNEVKFTTEVPGKIGFTKFCFEVLETSGYWLPDGSVQQRSVRMQDFQFWKCKWVWRVDQSHIKIMGVKEKRFGITKTWPKSTKRFFKNLFI